MNITKIVKAVTDYVTSLPKNTVVIVGIALLAVVAIAVAAAVVVIAVVISKKRKKTAVDKKFRVVEETICTDSNGVIFY